MNGMAERQGTARPEPRETGHDHDDDVARGRRLRLRTLGYGDIPWLSLLYAQSPAQPVLLDDSPTRFIEVAALVARVNQIYERHRGLGVWRADALDGGFIGTFSLMPVDATGEVEIGARLAPEALGRWYAIEGGRLLCRRAFALLGLPRLVGYLHPDNAAGARILARLGFGDTGPADYRGRTARRFELDARAWRDTVPAGA